MGQLKAILFDLDGTLIDVDLKKFVPGYLKLFANSVAHLIPPKNVVCKHFLPKYEADMGDGG